ncbi:hypothetical protein BGX30_006603 [Mortierella sp. GBA39]|nr:hypothetical protein BGX30_006603 [Mortierella sp. GBA39]
MAKRIQDMVDDSTDDKMDGKVSIVYERLGDLQWLPGKGDGEFLRRIKHWRLIIQLGFDAFTLEFLENSIVSYQGVLLVSPYDQGASNNATPYTVGYLKGLSTEELYKWIKDQSKIWKEYNLLTNNCQHFVHAFLAHFEDQGYLIRTSHLAAVNLKHEQPRSDQQEQEEQCQDQKGCQYARPVIPHPMQDQSLQYLHQHQHQQPQNDHSSHHNQNQQYRKDQQHQSQQHQSQQYEIGLHGSEDLQHESHHQHQLQQQQQQQYPDQRQQREQRVHSLGTGTRARPSSPPSSNWIPSIGIPSMEKVGRFIGDMGYKSKSFILPPPKRDDS